MIDRMGAAVAAVVWMMTLTLPAAAQVGKSQGLVDVNAVAERDLAALPGMTPAIAKAIVGRRPFATITELNALLLSQGLSQEQANAFYARAFVPINLNTATSDEILLVPGAGRRMTHEFAEYRPWRSYAQFDREIGKYVGPERAAQLAQYTFIPMNPNTASDADLQTIPAVTPATVEAIKSGRPYKSAADLETTLAKGATPAEAKRIARYFVVQ